MSNKTCNKSLLSVDEVKLDDPSINCVEKYKNKIPFMKKTPDTFQKKDYFCNLTTEFGSL